MARSRPSATEAREMLIEAATRYVNARPDALVILTTGAVEIVRQSPTASPPENVSVYDSRIVAALSDNALSPKRLARAAGLRFNSWFRARLGRLVDDGLARRVSRGYLRP